MFEWMPMQKTQTNIIFRNIECIECIDYCFDCTYAGFRKSIRIRRTMFTFGAVGTLWCGRHLVHIGLRSLHVCMPSYSLWTSHDEQKGWSNGVTWQKLIAGDKLHDLTGSCVDDLSVRMWLHWQSTHGNGIEKAIETVKSWQGKPDEVCGCSHKPQRTHTHYLLLYPQTTDADTHTYIHTPHQTTPHHTTPSARARAQ